MLNWVQHLMTRGYGNTYFKPLQLSDFLLTNF